MTSREIILVIIFAAFLLGPAYALARGYVDGMKLRARHVPASISELAQYGFIGGYTDEIDQPRFTEVRL